MGFGLFNFGFRNPHFQISVFRFPFRTPHSEFRTHIGHWALIVVPFPRRDSPANVPPESSARSLMLVSPSPCLVFSGSNPSPLSSMDNLILSAVFLRMRRARSAL